MSQSCSYLSHQKYRTPSPRDLRLEFNVFTQLQPLYISRYSVFYRTHMLRDICLHVTITAYFGII
jgi:hypothetical protein